MVDEYRPDWQLGTDWNRLLSSAIQVCYESMLRAHADATYYDEWWRSLEALRTLCIVSERDCARLDAKMGEVRSILYRDNSYTSDLDLNGDRKYRKKVDDAFRSVMTDMISTLHRNNLIIKTKRVPDEEENDFL